MKRLGRALIPIALIVAPLCLSGAAQAAIPPLPTTRNQAEDATIHRGAVKSDHAGFDGRGFVDYDSVRGGYVEWTVYAPVAGRAEIHFRYANADTAERASAITLNGQPSDTLFFTNTGSWDTWLLYTYTPLLKAGANRIRLTALTSRGGPNVDWLDSRITSATVDYQAEDAVISQGVVETEHPGYTGRGYVNTTNVAGGYVEWTVTAPVAGVYAVGWVFANATSQDRTTTLTINGTVVSDEWLFRSASGSWSTWLDAALSVTLVAGANTVRLTANTADGGPNYDKLLLYLPGPPA